MPAPGAKSNHSGDGPPPLHGISSAWSIASYKFSRPCETQRPFRAGIWSTVQIHNALKNRGIRILTIDSNYKWLFEYIELTTELHDLRHIEDADMPAFYKHDGVEWGVVFIDNSTWRARKLAVQKYKDVADYIVLHDCDYLLEKNHTYGKIIRRINVAEKDPGVRDYSKTFKYWIEFFIEDWGHRHPPVLLGSNKVCLDDIKGVGGMIISNRNA